MISVLAYHKSSLSQALKDLFPEVEWDRNKFSYSSKLVPSTCDSTSELFNLILSDGYWQDPQNRRKFMDEYAKARNFDPLVPHNWYSVSRADVLSCKV